MKKIFAWIASLFNKKSEPTKEVEQPTPEVEAPSPLPQDPQSEKAEEIADFKFVDSSHYHDYVDPKKYTARFLSHKCTQGTGMVDDKWAKTKVICKQAGIPLAGYMFVECKQDPIKQVDAYMKAHGSFELAPQVDYETYKTKYTEQTESDLMAYKENLYFILTELEKRTGMTPWLYINYGAAGRLKFDAKFGRFYAWFARYNSTLGPIPAPWTKETTAAWQYTESESFPGFTGGNDVNIYYGKVNALRLK